MTKTKAKEEKSVLNINAACDANCKKKNRKKSSIDFVIKVFFIYHTKASSKLFASTVKISQHDF